jgi:two-component system sensor histidine kinase BaeS
VLSDDSTILRKLSGFAATHADWAGVQTTVCTLSCAMDRRIALTSANGRPIADSAAPGTALPVRASAAVDPLSTLLRRLGRCAEARLSSKSDRL